jgi:hypothetical protein
MYAEEQRIVKRTFGNEEFRLSRENPVRKNWKSRLNPFVCKIPHDGLKYFSRLYIAGMCLAKD